MKHYLPLITAAILGILIIFSTHHWRVVVDSTGAYHCQETLCGIPVWTDGSSEPSYEKAQHEIDTFWDPQCKPATNEKEK